MIESGPESKLGNIRAILAEADQDKLLKVRTRFNGLTNAYKDDAEATAILNLLMLEYALLDAIDKAKHNQPTH